MARNIELKARLRDRAAADVVCGAIGAISQGEIHQVDTYFAVPEGRLKIREKEPGDDELIFYRRADTAESKASDYYIAPATPALKRVLTRAFGVLTVVDKVRGLRLWENVRIHLDRVEGLGDFLEFEAVLSEDYDDADGHAKLARLQQDFGIAPADLLSGSYLDLTVGSKGR